jgi:hypothetical protein
MTQDATRSSITRSKTLVFFKIRHNLKAYLIVFYDILRTLWIIFMMDFMNFIAWDRGNMEHFDIKFIIVIGWVAF